VSLLWYEILRSSCTAPDIPPMDRSNLCDTQNFEEIYLKMVPVISDEINVDRVEERAQTDAESIDDDDLIGLCLPLHPSDHT